MCDCVDYNNCARQPNTTRFFQALASIGPTLELKMYYFYPIILFGHFIASDGTSLHPVYVASEWWDSQLKTAIPNSKISPCAALSQKAAYKEAFSFDETSGLCQILENPANSQTKPIRFSQASGMTKIYVGANRVRPGRVNIGVSCRIDQVVLAPYFL